MKFSAIIRIFCHNTTHKDFILIFFNHEPPIVASFLNNSLLFLAFSFIYTIFEPNK